VQTGVQLLTGFLLTLPFQARFEQLSGYERTVYLITVALSVAATGFLIAPVSLHRTLFRRHARELMVTVSHRLAIVGLVLLGAAIVGVVLLIFDVVAGTAAGIIAAVAALVLLGHCGPVCHGWPVPATRPVPIPKDEQIGARRLGPAKPPTRVARSGGEAENACHGQESEHEEPQETEQEIICTARETEVSHSRQGSRPQCPGPGGAKRHTGRAEEGQGSSKKTLPEHREKEKEILTAQRSVAHPKTYPGRCPNSQTGGRRDHHRTARNAGLSH
jgi:hypothetical protein